MVSSATRAANTATMGTGARRMSASTIGIRTTAVAMRSSKGSWWGRDGCARPIFARTEEFHHRGHKRITKGAFSMGLSLSSEVKILLSPKKSEEAYERRRGLDRRSGALASDIPQ